MRVKISEKNIKEGTPGNPEQCPVALRLREIVSKGISVKVKDNYVCFLSVGGPPLPIGHSDSCLSESTTRAIRTYDSGEKIAPFSLDVHVPEWCLPYGYPFNPETGEDWNP